jgi:hypothetical protein
MALPKARHALRSPEQMFTERFETKVQRANLIDDLSHQDKNSPWVVVPIHEFNVTK